MRRFGMPATAQRKLQHFSHQELDAIAVRRSARQEQQAAREEADRAALREALHRR